MPDGSLRPLTALERERLMGLPDYFTGPLEHPEDPYWQESSVHTRMSAPRNGWHVPSVMIFIISMLRSCAPEDAADTLSSQYDSWSPTSTSSDEMGSVAATSHPSSELPPSSLPPIDLIHIANQDEEPVPLSSSRPLPDQPG